MSRAAPRKAERGAVADPSSWRTFAAAVLAHQLLLAQAEQVDPPADVAQRLASAAEELDRAREVFLATLDAVAGPFAQVAIACDLDQVDAAVLAVLVACEADPRALAGALALSERNLMRPTVDVLVRAFGADGLAAIGPGAPLARAGLIEVERATALSTAAIAVPQAVVWRVLDEPADPVELGGDVEVLQCPPHTVGSADRVLVHGPDRIRRLQAAITHTAGLQFYVAGPPVDEAGWRALTRRAGLDGAGIVIELSAAPDASLRTWISACPHLRWALCHREPIDLATLPAADWIEVPAADAAVTPAEWAAAFPGEELPPRRPSADQLRLATMITASYAEPGSAVHRVATGSLVHHAKRITPRATWDDLVMPSARIRQLHELVDRYRFRATVHERWNIPLYPSPGVVALFSGPSGTGKTTTAEVIAHDIGVDMFRIDLSALVSKYIGETEKNLEEIFAAAHAGDYLLLFDEADSLFGTRSKVTDARDRYANMEVSYLLQRLESYDGFVVLTSNFQGNIDQAFLRRIHVTVHFTMPSVEERVRIWERSLAGAPRADDLDLRFAAENFDLSGGSIRNAALTAAFLAAGHVDTVGMVELLRAISQELTKLGRRPSDDQFGRWLPALTAD